jgi:hypothetical protein
MSLRTIVPVYLLCALAVRSADKPNPAIIQVDAKDMDDRIIPAMTKAPSWDTLRRDFAEPRFRNVKTPEAYRLVIHSQEDPSVIPDHYATLYAPGHGLNMVNCPYAEADPSNVSKCAETLAAFVLKTEMIKKAAK